jgi:hypothetical protein
MAHTHPDRSNTGLNIMRSIFAPAISPSQGNTVKTSPSSIQGHFCHCRLFLMLFQDILFAIKKIAGVVVTLSHQGLSGQPFHRF